MNNSDFKTIFENPTIKDISVGQVWKCLENQQVVFIKEFYKEREIRGFLFDGFSVGNFFSLDAPRFIRYHQCIYNPERN